MQTHGFMGQRTHRPLSTTEPLQTVWRRLLELQVQFTWAEDLKFFMNEPRWLAARSVLDLGCGPGDWEERLVRGFPQKRYLGVDLSADYIELARRRFEGYSNLVFRQQDIYKVKADQPFDYILMRLVVQHLADLPLLLKRLQSLLTSDGRILMVEPIDTGKLCVPPVPELSQIYELLPVRQAERGGDRNALENLLPHLATRGFEVEKATVTLSAATTPDEKRLLVELYLHAFQVLNRHFGVEGNPKRLERELVAWLAHPESYGQIAHQRLLLKKIGATSYKN